MYRVGAGGWRRKLELHGTVVCAVEFDFKALHVFATQEKFPHWFIADDLQRNT